MSRAAFGVVQRAIEAGPIPGATVSVDGELACFGQLEPGGADVTDRTWWDLASLTKVLVTVPLLLEWIAAGDLDPMAPLERVLPDTAWMQPGPGLADATVLELATHTAGLAPSEPLYTLGLDRPTVLARIMQTSAITDMRGRVVYSDLGFMALGHVLERLAGEPLEVQAHRLFARLGLAQDLRYGPIRDGEVAPTEDCPWRGRVLRGEVHDENASSLGGISGHAGLFGTLRGVDGYARALLEERLHSAAVLDYASREHARDAITGERRGFGWMLRHPGWSGGDLVSDRTIGHTGFTGTGLWIDLARGSYSVLLTNRVHPSRHVESRIAELRRSFNHAAHA